MHPPAPLRLRPVFSTRIWGGARLPVLYPDALPGATGPIGEAWLAYGASVVEGDVWQGRTLDEVFASAPESYLGRRDAVRMPLLLKVLDAAQPLSLQVHPDDAYAARRHPDLGMPGKTESWRILEAEREATVVWGFRERATEEQVRNAVADATLERLLRDVPVEAGSVVHNPAGTVHAVGAGILLFEVQQSSDLTYRLYDYGRRGPDGLPRETHLDDALAVADLSGRPPAPPPSVPLPAPWRNRVTCPFYALDEVDLHGRVLVSLDGAELHVITPVEAPARLMTAGGEVEFPRGVSGVVPVAAGAYTVEGDGVLLRARANVAPA